MATHTSTHYLNLIAKEDFSSLKPLSNYNGQILKGIKLAPMSSGYTFTIRNDAIAPHSSRFSEGRIEGTGIYLKGDHFTEGSPQELHILFLHPYVHRFRFAIDQSGGGAPIEYLDNKGKVLARSALNVGWVDFTLDYDQSLLTSIAKVVIYLGNMGHYGPTLDSFEIFQWEPYAGIPIIPTGGDGVSTEPCDVSAIVWD